MSRSRKKPIYKDVGHLKRDYWKIVRRVQKQALKSGKDIPNPKSIVNDYGYSDYITDNRFEDDDFEWKIKLKRK